jgi:hypothetical protein
LCGEEITLGRASLDKKIRCPKCRSTIVISLESTAGSVSAPAAPPAEPREAAPERMQPEGEKGPALCPEDIETLSRIIASIEREPNRTYFVFLKDLGPATGRYQVRPGDYKTLGLLKGLLYRSMKETAMRNPGVAWSAISEARPSDSDPDDL